jgi:tight adherence protein B
MTLLVVALVVLTALAGRGALAASQSFLVRRRLDARAQAPAGTRAGVLWELLPPAPPRFARALDRAGVEADPAVAWWGRVGGVAVLGLVCLLIGGVPLAVLATVLGAAGPALVLRARRGQGDFRLERDLPAALEAVARSLRSGASLRQAIAEAAVAMPGRLGRELAHVARQVGHGATLVEALEGLAARRPVPGVRLAVAALCLAAETGGAQARAVDGVAATLRDRLGITAEVRALSSQARVSALVIGLAPIAFGGFAVTTDPRTGQFLFHTPVGLALLGVGITLDGLGWLWMQRLARVPV